MSAELSGWWRLNLGHLIFSDTVFRILGNGNMLSGRPGQVQGPRMCFGQVTLVSTPFHSRGPISLSLFGPEATDGDGQAVPDVVKIVGTGRDGVRGTDPSAVGRCPYQREWNNAPS